MEMDSILELAPVFKALSHKARLEIIFIIDDLGAASAGTLLDQVEVSKSDLTRHLRVLEEAGIIARHANGRSRYFTLKSRNLMGMIRQLGEEFAQEGIDYKP